MTPFTFAVIVDPHCTRPASSVPHERGLEHLGNGAARLRLCCEAIRRLGAGSLASSFKNAFPHSQPNWNVPIPATLTANSAFPRRRYFNRSPSR